MSEDRSRLPAAAAAGAAVAILPYAWWVTGLEPFTTPYLVAVLAAGVLAMLVAWQRPPRAVPTRWPAGSAIWALLILLLGAWQLAAFFQQPRDDHPTLSLLLNYAFEPQPVRALAFAGWLAVAYWLARR